MKSPSCVALSIWRRVGKSQKGLNKGCVLYTGASYTREITVLLRGYDTMHQSHSD